MPELIEAVVYDAESLHSLELNATKIDLLSLIGKFVYPIEELKHIANDIIDHTSFSLPLKGNNMYNNILIFGSMGHIICGMRDEVLTPVFEDDKVASYLLPLMGQLKYCDNPEALTIMMHAVRINLLL